MTPASSERPLARRAASRARAAARKLAGSSARSDAGAEPGPDVPAAGLDDWLRPLFGKELDRIASAVAEAGSDGYAEFRHLDDDLWSLLLTLEYEGWPAIRAFLPD
ncbi:MAG: hypothetical protein M3Y23_03130, partial [Actinomycetota bacterium]|nr:hypothetical protein [Actinomycetota bacterium]